MRSQGPARSLLLLCKGRQLCLSSCAAVEAAAAVGAPCRMQPRARTLSANQASSAFSRCRCSFSLSCGGGRRGRRGQRGEAGGSAASASGQTVREPVSNTRARDYRPPRPLDAPVTPPRSSPAASEAPAARPRRCSRSPAARSLRPASSRRGRACCVLNGRSKARGMIWGSARDQSAVCSSAAGGKSQALHATAPSACALPPFRAPCCCLALWQPSPPPCLARREGTQEPQVLLGSAG